VLRRRGVANHRDRRASPARGVGALLEERLDRVGALLLRATRHDTTRDTTQYSERSAAFT